MTSKDVDVVRNRFVAAIESWMSEQRLDIPRESTEMLRALAGDLADVLAPPRDIIRLYADALDRLMGVEMPEPRQEQLQLGARFVCLELMGLLAETYRRRLLGDAA